MKDRFPGWNPPTKAELHEYWTSGIVAIDANVLLNAYRYSQATRKDLLEALTGLSDRLWVPHRAAEEFHKNRMTVLIQQRNCGDQLQRTLASAQENLVEGLLERLSDSGRRDTEAFVNAIKGQFKELKRQVRKLDKEHHRGLGDLDDHRDDPLYDEIVTLLEGKVGESFSWDRMEEIPEEADARFQKNVPPGVGDADKDPDRKQGDVVVWFQLIEKAREEACPMIFVTDDRKDWMWEVKGKVVGPKPPLVAEMAKKAEQPFHAYSTAQFVQVANIENDRNIDAVISELEAAPLSRDMDAWGQHENAVRARTQREASQFRVQTPGASGMVGSPSSLSQVPHVFATNAVFSDEVVLSLVDDARALVGQEFICEVEDPFGQTTSCIFPPMPNRTKRSCSFPGDFPQSRILAEELYRVRWKLLPSMMDIAVDSFIVSGDELVGS